MRYIYSFVIAILFFLSIPHEAKASHGAGAELIYEWVSDSTYRFFFKFYRDCTGIQEDPTVQLCYYNDCNTNLYAISLNKINTLPDGTPNGTPLASGCPAFPSSCLSVTASIPGYREWWYTNTITLPSKCNSWHFLGNIVSRNVSVNIPGSTMEIEAVLNNLDAQGNSSPFFTVKPIPYVCIQTPYTYNNGALDINNDSLSFTVIMPLTQGTCYKPTNTVFMLGSPAYNLTNNPFQTNNSFSLNPMTGNVKFTPTLLGAHTIALKVSEYRNHKLIGSVIREIQIQSINCTNTIVNLTVPPVTLINGLLINGELNICANKQLIFCYDIVATDPTSILVTNDNHLLSIPTATITYSQQATDSIRGCFSWTPQQKDTGLKVLSVIVKDSTCRAPGIAVTQTFTIPIHVNKLKPPPQVVSPVFFCLNDLATPLQVTGSNILWYTSPITGVGSLTQPVINTNIVNTTIFYVSADSIGCESPRVPITVTVKPIPLAKIILQNDSICQFDKTTIRNIDTNQANVFYAWDADTAQYAGNANNSVIVANWKTPGIKYIFHTTTLNGCSISDTSTIFVVQTPTASFEIKPNTCVGDTTDLLPKVQDRSVYYWTIDNIPVDDTLYQSPLKLLWTNAGPKKLKLKVVNWFSCFSDYNTTVNVRDLPTAKIEIGSNEICTGGSISMFTQKGDHYNYQWQPVVLFAQNNLSDVTASINNKADVFLKVTNQWDCSTYDTAHISSDICCTIILPDAFTPNSDGINDKFHILTREGQLKLITFIITDRWGKILYNSADLNAGWDGNFKGIPQDLGTYYYYIKSTCNSAELEKKGNFILIR